MLNQFFGKRLWALLLALFMMVQLLPAVALADGEEPVPEDTSKETIVTEENEPVEESDPEEKEQPEESEQPQEPVEESVLSAAEDANDGTFPSGSCGAEGDNVTWILKANGELYISGSGRMADYNSYTETPWTRHIREIKRVVIDSGVTNVGASAFNSCSNLTSVTIPSGVTQIGSFAFYKCGKLKSASIPSGVKSIGKYAFCDCSSFEYSESTDATMAIPSGVTSIGSYAFSGCDRLEDVAIPGSVSSIAEYAFEGCDQLGRVVIKQGVTSIGKCAFLKCSNLKHVTIPEGVSSIGIYAFDQCYSLKSITLPDSMMSIGAYAFSGCSITSMVIPSGVKKIENNTFSGCHSLTSVTLPSSVTYIGYGAFLDCESLSNISIPSNVTYIGGYAFQNCESLKSISIPYGVSTIEEGTFVGSGLSSVTIPSNVRSIGDYAFNACKLTSVTIPSSVTSIGNEAFRYCGNLSHVYYQGKQTKWDSISIGSDNDPLINATKHFAPTITSQPESITVAEGSNALFVVVVDGGNMSNLSFQWYCRTSKTGDWKIIDNATARRYEVTATKGISGYQYRCKVANSLGSDTSEAATLIVLAAPKVEGPGSKEVKAGNYHTFEVTATAPAGYELSYQWECKKPGKTWNNLTNVIDSTCRVKAETSKNGNQYRCKVWITGHENVFTYSSIATLTVFGIATQPQNQSVVVGDKVEFTLSATGSNLQYQWYYQKPSESGSTWHILTGQTTNRYSRIVVRGLDGYKYRCKVWNSKFTVYSNTVTLTVRTDSSTPY